MKRKIFLCLLVLVGIVAITGCGEDNKTMVDIEGKKYSTSEIKKIANENEIEYDDNIRGKKIVFTGTINKVETTSMSSCTCYNEDGEMKYMKFEDKQTKIYKQTKIPTYVVSFDEGISLYVSQDSIDKSILKVGNKLEVESNIAYVDKDTIEVSTTNIEKSKCFEVMDVKYYNECYSGSKVTLK